MEETTFDPKRRRLCPDGACIGLIGPDGRCKVCGRAADGSPVTIVKGDVSEEGARSEDEDEDEDSDEHKDEGMQAEGAEAGGAKFDPKRRLCDDGSCVGVVGADGVCLVCGWKVEG